MSDVVWCDIGGHLFSANDPEREFWTPNNDPYNQTKSRMDACGRHKIGTVAFPTLPTLEEVERLRKQIEEAGNKAGMIQNGGNKE